MASIWYRKQILSLLTGGTLDLATGDIRVLLVNDTYTFSHSHQYVSDVSASEIVATNYARKILANKQVVEDTINNMIVFSADDLLYNLLGGSGSDDTVAAAIAYKWVTSDSDSPLVVYSDVIENWITSGGNNKLIWPSTGIARFRLL